MRNYIQFFWDRIRALGNTLCNLGQSPGNENTPQGSQQAPPPILRAELQIPQSVIERYDTNDKRTERFQVGTFVTGVVGLIVLILTLWETQKATRVAGEGVEVTRRAVEISQRAWVIAIEFVKFTEPPKKEDRTLVVPLVVENSGKTPALYLQGKSSVGCTQNPNAPLDWPRISYALTSTEYPQAVLGPGQKTPLLNVLTLHSDCSMDQVLTHKISLIVFGYINYWDEFGPMRGMIFCGVYVPNEQRFQFCGHDNLPW